MILQWRVFQNFLLNRLAVPPTMFCRIKKNWHKLGKTISRIPNNTSSQFFFTKRYFYKVVIPLGYIKSILMFGTNQKIIIYIGVLSHRTCLIIHSTASTTEPFKIKGIEWYNPYKSNYFKKKISVIIHNNQLFIILVAILETDSTNTRRFNKKYLTKHRIMQYFCTQFIQVKYYPITIPVVLYLVFFFLFTSFVYYILRWLMISLTPIQQAF